MRPVLKEDGSVAVLALFALVILSIAGSPAPARAAVADCATQWTQLDYAASFDWPVPGKSTRKMKIEVGSVMLHRNAEPVIVAKISNGSACQVLCRTKTFEKEGPYTPMALEMSCQASAFDPLTTPATLFWPAALGTKTPVLRFGSWLDGYRNAPLRVEMDRYSARRVAEAR